MTGEINILNLFSEMVEPAFKADNEVLILGDTFSILKNIKPGSITMIFADPPYFLSNDGITCQAGKMVSVNKGEWDKAPSLNEKHEFNNKSNYFSVGYCGFYIIDIFSFVFIL